MMKRDVLLARMTPVYLRRVDEGQSLHFLKELFLSLLL
jgi:hypothetical protein